MTDRCSACNATPASVYLIDGVSVLRCQAHRPPEATPPPPSVANVHGADGHKCATCSTVHVEKRPLCFCGGYDHEHWGGPGKRRCAVKGCPCPEFRLANGVPPPYSFVRLDVDPEEADDGPGPAPADVVA